MKSQSRESRRPFVEFNGNSDLAHLRSSKAKTQPFQSFMSLRVSRSAYGALMALMYAMSSLFPCAQFRSPYPGPYRFISIVCLVANLRSEGVIHDYPRSHSSEATLDAM